MANNLIYGHTRQLYLCYGALAGIGGYFSALLSIDFSINPWATLVVGSVIAGGVSIALSAVTAQRRLGIIFIGILTFGLEQIFQDVVTGLGSVTGGDTGIFTPSLSLGPFAELGHGMGYYYLFATVLGIVLFMYYRVTHTKIGLALRAINFDEQASELTGIHVKRYKILTALSGGLILGFAGGLYSYFNFFIAPSLFSIANFDTIIYVTLILGGIASTMGPLLGSAIYIAINEFLSSFGILSELFLGVVLILLFLFFRDGIVNYLRKFGIELI